MSSKHIIEDARPRETTAEEEAAALSDDDLMDSMNLATARTGIDGIIFISTAMGAHGPRVKYFEKRGNGQPSFSVSISSVPKVLASSLPERVVRKISPLVIDWVRLNRQALLDFWEDGGIWSEEDVDQFRNSLKKV